MVMAVSMGMGVGTHRQVWMGIHRNHMGLVEVIHRRVETVVAMVWVISG